MLLSREAVLTQPGPSRPTAQVVSRSPPSRSATLRRSSIPLTAVRSRGADCSWRRVPRSCERVLSDPELEGGPLAAQPVSPSGKVRQSLSSIVVITTVCRSSILLTQWSARLWLSAPLEGCSKCHYLCPFVSPSYGQSSGIKGERLVVVLGDSCDF